MHFAGILAGEVGIAEDVARVYSRSGRNPAVAHVIELSKQLAKRRYADPADIAYSYADLGDGDQASAWLDKALAEKSGGLQNVKIVHGMDQFHSDPCYIELLKKIDMPR